MSDSLERAMRQNPHLKVHLAYGSYDGVTPEPSRVQQSADLATFARSATRAG